jgi:glycosyltransferase involved in cell wall biosynthesis
LLYYAKKNNAKLILSYHFIPHSFFAFFASSLSRIPFSISQTGLLIQKLSDRNILGGLIIYIFKKALLVNVPGTSSQKHWIKKGVEPSKIQILHSTISTELFSNSKSKKEFDFIFMGRLAPEKNIELIIQAFVSIKKDDDKINMLIVGDGPERKKLEALVVLNNLTTNITFVGFQNNVATWLNKAEIFVMSSTTDAMPTALMQAMACELICISSEVGNISDLINHQENGFLYESNDLEALTNLMRNALKKRTDYLILRKEAREAIIKNHSHVCAKTKWEALINELD